MKRPVFVTFYFCNSERFILFRYAHLSVFTLFYVLNNVRFSVCIPRSANAIVPIFMTFVLVPYILPGMSAVKLFYNQFSCSRITTWQYSLFHLTTSLPGC